MATASPTLWDLAKAKKAWIDTVTERLLPYLLSRTHACAKSLYQLVAIDFNDPTGTPVKAVVEDAGNR